MAIFVDHRVQALYPGHNRDIQWHKTHGVLAVGSFSEAAGAIVTVYQEEVFLTFYSFSKICSQQWLALRSFYSSLQPVSSFCCDTIDVEPTCLQDYLTFFAGAYCTQPQTVRLMARLSGLGY